MQGPLRPKPTSKSYSSGVELPLARSAAGIGRVISSAALLSGRREVWIEHAGALYRLQVTTANKLILTK